MEFFRRLWASEQQPVEDINVVNVDGYTRLMAACIDRDVREVERLIAAGADVDATNNENITAFVLACEIGNIYCAKALMAAMVHQSGNTDCIKNSYGVDKAMLSACEHRRFSIVSLLIEGGCPVNVRGRFQETPLMVATIAGNVRCVEILIGAAADVNAVDENGNTALLHASNRGYSVIVSMLIRAGANVNYVCWTGTALHAACRRIYDMTGGRIGSKIGTSIRSARILLESGADVNARDPNEATPLMIACGGGDSNLVQMLLDDGADIDASNLIGETAVSCAINHVECLRQVLSMNPDVGMVNSLLDRRKMFVGSTGVAGDVNKLLQDYVDTALKSGELTKSATKRAAK
jgi:uncharacterized protein